MPVAPIPFGNKAQSIAVPGAQSTQQTGSVMRDVYVDLSGNIVKRPVLKLFCDTGESGPVNGLYNWDNVADGVVITDGALIAVANGSPYHMREYTAANLTEITSGTYAAFSTSNYARVSFTEVGSKLYAANGGKIKEIAFSSVFSVNDLTDADAPTTVSSVTSIDRYLIAVDDGTGNFYWSAVNAPTSWEGYYAEAESNPDKLYHAQNIAGMLYLIGGKTTEIFYNDGVSPFSRLTQGTISSGSVAKRGIHYCDSINTFVWRTALNQFVKIDGKVPTPISPSLDQFVSYNYSQPKDDTGYYFMWDGMPFYMYSAHGASYGFSSIGVPGTATIPKSGWSVAINLFTGDWYEWGSYYSAENRYLPFQAASIVNTPAGTFVGDANDGLIHRMARGGADETAYGAMDPMIRSIDLDRGDAGVWKFCKSLTFKFSAPQTHTGASFQVDLKYSDDGGSTWSAPRAIRASIPTGQKAAVVRTFNLGRYRSRQWQIDFTTTEDIALGPVIEDFDYVS